jgi:tetratricopeptide (TPR) repeat protein
VGAVEAIDERTAQALEDALVRLERKQFVQRVRRSSVSGESEYVFRHVLLRDVAYGQIPRADRSEKHRRAAEWIESRGRAEDQAEMLADHYVNALEYAGATGDDQRDLFERAGAAMRNAGDRAAALAAYPTAVRFYEAALALSPDDPQLLLRLGRVRFSADSGGAEELEAALDRFLELDDHEGAAEAALGLKTIAWYEGDGDRARRWLDRSLELVQGQADSPTKATALVEAGGMHQVNAEFDQAIRVGLEALPLVERFGLDVLRSRLLACIGTARASLGDPQGIAELEQSVEIARAAGDVARLHAAMNNLSGMQGLFGRTAEEARTYEELAESVERFGRDTDRRWVRASMGEIRRLQGRWDEALELLEPFIAQVEAGSPHYLEPQARASRASIRLGRDDLAGASADTERARASARLAEDAQLVAAALVARGGVLLAEGRRTEATTLIDEALALGGKLLPLSHTVVELGWIARAVGRERQLLGVLQSATELPWLSAAIAVASGDTERSASLLAQIECPTAEANMRLRAAQELVDAGRGARAKSHVEAALAFYREVRATRFVREAEALQHAIAGRPRRSASTG